MAEPFPPPGGTFWFFLSTEYVHDVPAWLMVNVRPPTLIVPLRCDELELAVTVKLMVALPDPVVGALTVIQLALSVAVHEQLAPAVSPNDPPPPVEGMFALEDEMEYVQGAAA